MKAAKHERTRANPALLSSALERAVEQSLREQDSYDLGHYLRHFKDLGWKTSATFAVPGLCACEGLFQNLLVEEPTAASCRQYYKVVFGSRLSGIRR